MHVSLPAAKQNLFERPVSKGPRLSGTGGCQGPTSECLARSARREVKRMYNLQPDGSTPLQSVFGGVQGLEANLVAV